MGDLPPGFRFYPTDEELVVHFLHRKASLLPCHPDVIPDLDLYPYDPWDLNGKALTEGRKWYYYSRRTSNRMAESGCWKPMGIDEPVYSNRTGKRVGMKKYYTFHLGNDEESESESESSDEYSSSTGWTNWVMHEYRLPDRRSSSSGTTSSSRRSDHSRWVICKVFEENCDDNSGGDSAQLSCLDEVFLSMDDCYDEIISYPS